VGEHLFNTCFPDFASTVAILAFPSMAVNIAADGDLALVVGPEELKILVNFSFLKAASKSFSAMLNPPWTEGQNMLNRMVEWSYCYPKTVLKD